MGALEVLLWILAGIGGVILLTIIAVIGLLIWAAVLGFSKMRDVEDVALPGRGTR